jgi:syntaxin 5
MAIDRTSEFHAAVSAISSRISKSPAESRRLLSSSYTNNNRVIKSTPKSEFSRMAAKIGHDISSTSAKLQRLAQRTSYYCFPDCALHVVAKRKTLFDDKSTEISELIYVIKHDIAELNNDIGNLQTFVKQRRNNNARATKGKKGSELNEHNDNVVVLLQSKLANTSMGFKEVLEIRTQVHKYCVIPMLMGCRI